MLTFVIARFKEDLAWVNRLPAGARIHIYNKGPEIEPGVLRRDDVRVTALKNAGRESGTYMHYLINDFRPEDDGFTVFTQGDPFEHAPAFLELMEVPHLWSEIQPLSVQWVEEKKIPPRKIVEEDCRDWIGHFPIRTEHFSLTTWAPIGFFDEGAWGIGNTYRQKHLLPQGTNVAEHFFDFCGLDWLADAARGADVGAFSYGAIFAVSNRRVADFVQRARNHLDKLDLLTRADMNYGYIFERCWLHFFGEPFIRFEAHRPAVGQAASWGQGAQPASVTPQVASIGTLRSRAYEALGRGQVREAQALLEGALQIDGANVELLTDLATLAMQQHDAALASEYARRALRIEPAHGLSQFTLAMCLASTGRERDALDLFEALDREAYAQSFREQNPELATLVGQQAARLRATLAQPA
jgi:tetratricopeptide (TPR) repeat protein